MSWIMRRRSGVTAAVLLLKGSPPRLRPESVGESKVPQRPPTRQPTKAPRTWSCTNGTGWRGYLTARSDSDPYREAVSFFRRSDGGGNR
jgi:hypothetical protein